ncbi:MAG: hypothetical protein ACRC1K_08295, partial [Planctomycetia bacterium]
VAEQFPDDLASEADFARMKKLVEDANRVRAAERIEAKLSDYRKQNAAVWTDAAELKAAAASATPKSGLDDDAEFTAFDKTLDGYTAAVTQPFARQNRPPDGDAHVVFNLRATVAALDWVLRPDGPDAPKTPATLNIRLLADGEPVEEVAVGREVVLEATSSRRGWLTLVAKADDGTTTLLWSRPLEADRPTKFFQTAGDEPGVDELAAFVTDADPFEKQPRPPVGEPDEPAEAVPGFLSGMRVRNLDVEQIDLLRGLFAHTLVFRRVQAALTEGRAYDTLEPRGPSAWTLRRTFSIRVVP